MCVDQFVHTVTHIHNSDKQGITYKLQDRVQLGLQYNGYLQNKKSTGKNTIVNNKL